MKWWFFLLLDSYQLTLFRKSLTEIRFISRFQKVVIVIETNPWSFILFFLLNGWVALLFMALEPLAERTTRAIGIKRSSVINENMTFFI